MSKVIGIDVEGLKTRDVIQDIINKIYDGHLDELEEAIKKRRKEYNKEVRLADANKFNGNKGSRCEVTERGWKQWVGMKGTVIRLNKLSCLVEFDDPPYPSQSKDARQFKVDRCILKEIE
jgi:hypothetical protein